MDVQVVFQALGLVVGACLAFAFVFLVYVFAKAGRQSGRAGRFQNVVVGHRGCMNVRDGAGVIPENTMPAFEYAANCGAQAIELDCMLTRDGEVVVFHDHDTKRLLGVEKSVDKLTLAELRRIPFPNYRGGTVFAPTLAEVLAFAKARGLLVLVETKEMTAAKAKTLARKVVKIVRDAGMADSVIVISFNPVALYYTRVFAPTLPSVMLEDTDLSDLLHHCDFPRYTRWIMYLLSPVLMGLLSLAPLFVGADMVGPHYSAVTRRYANFWSAVGYGVYAWTVNDPLIAKDLLSLGASIATDDVAKVLRKAS